MALVKNSADVTVRLIGGLGNQMFQYATGYALAHRYGKSLLLDIRAFNRYRLHRYGLGSWKISARIAEQSELVSTWRVALMERFSFVTWSWCFKERDLCFDQSVFNSGGVRYILGYFQSESYFKDVRDQLVADFSLSRVLEDVEADTTAAIRECSSVCVHVRRGDYVSNKETFRIHGVCSAEYYHNAMALIAQIVPNPHFFVFSNDFDWVRSNLVFPGPHTLLDGVSKDSAGDIALMSACKHHIIANSSFSWWGAWLSENTNGIKIAPTPWYDDPSYPERDLIPSGWVRIAK